MAKRKLEQDTAPAPNKKAATSSTSIPSRHGPAIQIITGSYDRVLHGVTAWLPFADNAETTFNDAFLYQPHMSRITAVAVSVASGSNKRILATGSADERINLYQISTTTPSPPSQPPEAYSKSSKFAVTTALGNKELGSLLHHNAPVTNLWFAGRTKLLSGAEDNTIAITRLRDMSTLSTIKAPAPKAQNRPSGDTATASDMPKGINGFAVHPSMKLMVSVGRGERSMRLWNLVTGKKAGVLNFEKAILAEIGEGKYSKGEGVSVEWDPEGEEFVVAFERGALVFGMDAKPKSKITTREKTKFHRIRYLPKHDNEEEQTSANLRNVVAISTEDGRILFFSTNTSNESGTADGLDRETVATATSKSLLPECALLGQIGGRAVEVTSRVKDFEILCTPRQNGNDSEWCVVAGSSDGTIRVWRLRDNELSEPSLRNGQQNGTTKTKHEASACNNAEKEVPPPAVKQVGTLIGKYSTENRVTCVAAFLLDSDHETPSHETVVSNTDEEDSDDDGD